MLHCHQIAISSHFRDTGPYAYWGHDLDLSESRDDIGHVTFRFPATHFLYALHFHQVAISSRFRDNGYQTYWGHDLDLSGSRDVIGHVTILFPGTNFL